MGDWNSPPVPTFTAGQPVFGADLQKLADIGAALTGAWTSYTPTLANLTVGSGTMAAAYRRLGNTLDVRFRFVYGVGSAVGSNPTVSLPAGMAFVAGAYGDSVFQVGHIMLTDATTANRSGFITANTTSSVFNLWSMDVNGALVSITSTVPWTWTTNDVIAFTVQGVELA